MEALEHSQLWPVAQRIACRIRANRQVQAHHRAPATKLRQRDVGQPAVLESPESTPRGSRCRRRLTQAESATDPCSSVLEAKPQQRLMGAPSSAINRPLASTHGWMIRRGARLAIPSYLPAHCHAGGDKERTTTRENAPNGIALGLLRRLSRWR